MILSDFFDQVNATYRGSDDDAPTTGVDYDLWLFTTNRKIREWATDPNARWRSRFNATYSPGTVVAGTQSYNLASTFFAPADQVIVSATDGNDLTYTLVAPQDRGTVSSSVYISGSNPQVLTFYDDIVSGAEAVGGTIYLPSYSVPADLTTASDTIPVDDPYWLVYAVAAELAFNDLTYEDKFGDLVAKANDRYAKMLRANRQGSAANPRVARYNVTRIPGSTQ